MKQALGGTFASLQFSIRFKRKELEEDTSLDSQSALSELTGDSSEEPELVELHSEEPMSIKILASPVSVDIMIEERPTSRIECAPKRLEPLRNGSSMFLVDQEATRDGLSFIQNKDGSAFLSFPKKQSNGVYSTIRRGFSGSLRSAKRGLGSVTRWPRRRSGKMVVIEDVATLDMENSL
jgi:hypothetical protein